MKTRELTKPEAGMIVFSDSHRLMAKVTKVKEDGFKFHVLNGMWDGTVKNDCLIIHLPNQNEERGTIAFREVLAVTQEEYDGWYMQNATGASRLISLAAEESSLDEQHVDPDAEILFEEDSPAFETTIILKIVGQDDGMQEFEGWIAGKSLVSLAHEIESGDLVASKSIAGTREIPRGQIAHVLKNMGNDGSFIEAISVSDPQASNASSLIEAVKIDQGWDDYSVSQLAEQFIHAQGLSHLYAEHLQKQASDENDYDGPSF